MTTFRLSSIDVVWSAIGVLLAAVLLMPPQHAGDRLGVRRHLTPEISEGWRFSQRFRMNDPQLSSVAIRAEAVGPVSGRVILRLQDRDDRGIERSVDVAAADLVRERTYVFNFDPIARSADHEFELEIAPSPDEPARGVALWANKGPREAGAALSINGERRWGSLAFQTATPAVSFLGRLLRGGEPARPPAWLALAGLFGGWLTLRFVLRAVAGPAATLS